MNWTAQYFYPHSWRAAARRPVSRPPKHGICQFLYGEFLPLVYYIGILRWKLRASMKRKRTNPAPAKKLDYSTRQPREAVEQIVVNIQILTKNTPCSTCSIESAILILLVFPSGAQERAGGYGRGRRRPKLIRPCCQGSMPEFCAPTSPNGYPPWR